MSKQDRHDAIKQLITKKAITSQEMLAQLLSDQYGIDVTQATLSKDLKALQIKRLFHKKTNQKIYQLVVLSDQKIPQNERFLAILTDYGIAINQVSFMVIIKTEPSMGNVVAASLDQANWEQVLGTMAGFDTIFVAMSSEQIAQQTGEIWHNYIKNVEEL